ncbi:hypothetical protein DERP_011760 [Dermatophagoides pteronyssinus]|uniref:Uncharacterized protein n=1 Tax=Dermatophagoides pteronyssinus TaxID=6956 RepID=A0ABQ8J3C7_DERPT|nr:hypothetical protein DERP_011760 [Dermatophagoides pteronyssinus]
MFITCDDCFLCVGDFNEITKTLMAYLICFRLAFPENHYLQQQKYQADFLELTTAEKKPFNSYYKDDNDQDR